jgi:MFS transporter, CP family, cyanate transporter
MPVAVKERFAHRPAFASGIYTTGIQVGSALSSALAVPIAAAWGGWRAGLALFSACTASSWPAGCCSRLRIASTAGPRRRVCPGVGVSCGASPSCSRFSPSCTTGSSRGCRQERGWSDESAGALLGVMSVAAVPGGFLVPYFADRRGSRRQCMELTAGAIFVGTIGVRRCRMRASYGPCSPGSASARHFR